MHLSGVSVWLRGCIVPPDTRHDTMGTFDSGHDRVLENASAGSPDCVSCICIMRQFIMIYMNIFAPNTLTGAEMQHLSWNMTSTFDNNQGNQTLIEVAKLNQIMTQTWL